MEKSEKVDLLATALVAAQKEMPLVAKDAKNPFFHSSYATLAAVLSTCLPILNKFGLAVSQFPSTTFDGKPALTTVLMHISGQYIAESCPLSAKGGGPQDQGSAITYLRRYSFHAVTGTASEDDDGNGSREPEPRKPDPKKTPELAQQPKKEVAPSKLAANQPEVTPVCCGNKMLISLYDQKNWYCRTCKKLRPVANLK